MDGKTVFRFFVLVAAAAVVVVAASGLREKRGLALAAVDDIEAQLAALDPVTRAGVVARLSADAATKVKDMSSQRLSRGTTSETRTRQIVSTMDEAAATEVAQDSPTASSIPS